MKKILVLLLLAHINLVEAKDVIKEMGTGGVNWTTGVIYANGYGVAPEDTPEYKKRLLARRAAQVDAYRNLAEILEGVRVNSETTIQDLTLKSDTVKTKVEGLIKGSSMIADRYQNNVAQVTLEIKMDGGLATITNKIELETNTAETTLFEKFQLKVAAIASNISITKAHASLKLINSANELEFAQRLLNATQDNNLRAMLEAEIRAYGDMSLFTGLLIDASNVPNFQLATIPRIRDANGDVIYPRPELFEAELAAKRPVSYDFDVDDAINNDRVAINPYVVKAVGTFKSRDSDLVLDESSVNLITNNQKLMEVINTAGVMIVVSP